MATSHLPSSPSSPPQWIPPSTPAHPTESPDGTPSFPRLVSSRQARRAAEDTPQWGRTPTAASPLPLLQWDGVEGEGTASPSSSGGPIAEEMAPPAVGSIATPPTMPADRSCGSIPVPEKGGGGTQEEEETTTQREDGPLGSDLPWRSVVALEANTQEERSEEDVPGRAEERRSDTHEKETEGETATTPSGDAVDGCSCAVVDVLIAHYQSLLARGVVLDRYNHKELALAWWVIGRNMDTRALDHPGTARREALLITIRNFYYSQLSSKRRPSTGMVGERGSSGATTEEWPPAGVGEEDRLPFPTRLSGPSRLSSAIEEESGVVVDTLASPPLGTAPSISPRRSASHRMASEGGEGPPHPQTEQEGAENTPPRHRLLSAEKEEDRSRRVPGRGGRRRGRDEEEEEGEEEEEEEAENGPALSSRHGAVAAVMEGQEKTAHEMDDRDTKKRKVEWEKGERNGKIKGKAGSVQETHEKEDHGSATPAVSLPLAASESAALRRAAPTSREAKRWAMEEHWVRSSSRAHRHARSPERMEVFEALMHAVRVEEETLRHPTSPAFLAPLPVPQDGRPVGKRHGEEGGTTLPAAMPPHEGDEEERGGGRRPRHKATATKMAEKKGEAVWEAVGGSRRSGRSDGREERTTSTPAKHAEASALLPSSVASTSHDHRVKSKKVAEEEKGKTDLLKTSSSSSGVPPKSRKKGRESSRDVDREARKMHPAHPEEPPVKAKKGAQDEPIVQDDDEKGRRKKRRTGGGAAVHSSNGEGVVPTGEKMGEKRTAAAAEAAASLSPSSPLVSTSRRKKNHFSESHAVPVPFSSSSSSSSIPIGGTGSGDEGQDGKKRRKKSHADAVSSSSSSPPLRTGHGAALSLAALFSSTPAPTDALTTAEATAPASSSSPARSLPVPLSTLQKCIQERLRFRLYGGGGGVPLASSTSAVGVPNAPLSSSSSSSSASPMASVVSDPPPAWVPSPSPQEYLHLGGYPSHLLSAYRFLLLSGHHLTPVDPADRSWPSAFPTAALPAIATPRPVLPNTEAHQEGKDDSSEEGCVTHAKRLPHPVAKAAPLAPSVSPIPPYYRAHIPALAAVDHTKEQHGGIDPALMGSSFFRHNHREWATYMFHTLSEYYERQKAKKREEQESEKMHCQGIEPVKDGDEKIEEKESASCTVTVSRASLPFHGETTLTSGPNDAEKRHGTVEKEENEKEHENNMDGHKDENSSLPTSHALPPCVGESSSTLHRRQTRIPFPTENIGESASRPATIPETAALSDASMAVTALPGDVHSLTYAQQCLLVWEADCLLDNAVSRGRDEGIKEERDWCSKRSTKGGAHASFVQSSAFPMPRGTAHIDYWSEYR